MQTTEGTGTPATDPSALDTFCMEGCLKCREKKCLFCDFLLGYFLTESGYCKKGETTNCQQVNYDGKCLVCVQNYFPQSDGTCAEVAEAERVENCAIYGENSVCAYCQKDHYLATDSCVAVENKIDNCALYSNSGKNCEVCESGSFLYIDKKYCIYLESFRGCAFWSQLHCNSCIDNYYYNKNSYLVDLFKRGDEKSKMYQYISNKEKGDIYSFVTQTCIKSKLKNC